jgi:hypothetical protein
MVQPKLPYFLESSVVEELSSSSPIFEASARRRDGENSKDPLHLEIRLSMSVKVRGWIEGSIARVKPQHDALLYAEE